MIFTLFLTCIFGLGALQPQVAAPRSNEIQVVESKPRKELNVYYGYMVSSSYEIFSNPLFYNTYFSDTFFNCSTVGTRFSLFSLTDGSICYLQWIYLNTSDPETSIYNNGYPLNNIYFEYRGGGSFSNVRYQQWDLHLGFGSYSDFIYSIEIMYSNSTTDNSIISVTFIAVTSYPSGVSTSYYLIARSNSSLYTTFVTNGGYGSGYYYGYNQGYDEGMDIGYEQGVIRGKEIAQDPNSDIYDTIYDTGYNAGQQDGYSTGYSDGSSDSGVPAIIFSGILSVALIPVNVFIQMFQYEVFGINVAGLVSALITIAMVIIIVRFLLGGKTDDK